MTHIEHFTFLTSPSIFHCTKTVEPDRSYGFRAKNSIRAEVQTKDKDCPLVSLWQCFSTARSRPVTGPWHRLYRSSRGSPGICHFSFL